MINKISVWRGRIALIILSIAFTIIVLEIAIRVYDAATGYGFFSNHRNVVAGGVKPILPFRTFGFELYRTQEGIQYISSRYGELYPLQKKEKTFRIVVLGGSTSENGHSFQTAHTHYPMLLESKLQHSLNRETIEVINVASSGYATVHSLIQLELDVLSWDPDLIIVSHNINDLVTAYWPSFTFDYSHKYSTTFYSVPDLKTVYSPSNIIFQHSQLYWVVQSYIDTIFKKEQSYPLQRVSYGYELPSLVTGVFKRNLQSIVTLAKANEVEVVLATQPLLPDEDYFLDHMRYKPYNSIVLYPLHEEFVQHHHTYNRIIEEVAKENQTLFIDMDALLAEQPEYFIDFVHYTPEGVEALAENYANLLIESGAITK